MKLKTEYSIEPKEAFNGGGTLQRSENTLEVSFQGVFGG